jgi:5S rRNA maturation endonuclease (ribonuclease M5)
MPNVICGHSKDRNKTDQIIQYLTVQRRIPRQTVITLIQSGKLYADAKGNAVFLLLGKEKKIMGAELRGTGSIQWRGMAPGSRKHLGCFYVLGESNKKMIFCESAIDAISCQVLWPEYTAISTSGANHNPAWLKKFIAHGCKIYCCFDSDRIGNMLADKMIKLYPSIKRLRPSRHDWNEVLQNHNYPYPPPI